MYKQKDDYKQQSFLDKSSIKTVNLMGFIL